MTEVTKYLGFNDAGDPAEEFFLDLDAGEEFEDAICGSIEEVKQSPDYIKGRTRFLSITVKEVNG